MGAWSFVWGAKPPKAPRGDRTGSNPRIITLLKQWGSLSVTENLGIISLRHLNFSKASNNESTEVVVQSKTGRIELSFSNCNGWNWILCLSSEIAYRKWVISRIFMVKTSVGYRGSHKVCHEISHKTHYEISNPQSRFGNIHISAPSLHKATSTNHREAMKAEHCRQISRKLITNLELDDTERKPLLTHLSRNVWNVPKQEKNLKNGLNKRNP